MKPNNHTDVDALRESLSGNLDTLLKELLPAAKLHGTHYRVGSLHGEPGASLAIDRSTALWIDHATGQKGDVLELIMRLHGFDFKKTIEWSQAWLGCSFANTTPPQPAQQVDRPAQTSNKLQAHNNWQLAPPTNKQLQQVSDLFGIGREGLIQAAQRGHLFCSDNSLITVTDSTRYVRADRRIDGAPLALANGKTVKTRTVGSATWPLGAADFGNRPFVLLCEGFSDFLAGNHLVAIENVAHQFNVCAVLGAGIGINAEALPHFKDKRVLIFADADGPGIRGARRWRDQLKPVASAVRFFNLRGLHRNDGKPVKDLRDFLSVDIDVWESEAEIRYPLCNFISQFKKT